MNAAARQATRAATPDEGWPSAQDVPKRAILGIPLAMTDYEQAMDVMDSMIARREPGYVFAVAVHAVMVSQADPQMLEAVLGSTLTVPDGMPLVWAANALGERLHDRVYGPELMRRYNRRCAEQGHRVWLYGGHDPEALEQLVASLRCENEGIRIVGSYSPPFRELTPAEEDAVVGQINDAHPDVLWVGTGVPRQEKWSAHIRGRLEVPVICAVGAAFDFHAGRVAQAPAWMQKRGLEWVYRMTQEPRRLIPRYLYYNPRFVIAFARQFARERRTKTAPAGRMAGGNSRSKGSR